eukprot:1153651_1
MAEVINCPGRTIGFNERVFLDPVCSMSPLTDPIQVPRDHPIKALRLPEAHGSSEPNVGSSESDGFVGRNNARIPKAVRNRQTAVFTPPDSPQGNYFSTTSHSESDEPTTDETSDLSTPPLAPCLSSRGYLSPIAEESQTSGTGGESPAMVNRATRNDRARNFT